MKIIMNLQDPVMDAHAAVGAVIDIIKNRKRCPEAPDGLYIVPSEAELFDVNLSEDGTYTVELTNRGFNASY